MTEKETFQGNYLIANFLNLKKCYGVLETGGNPLKAIYPANEIKKYARKGYKVQLSFHHSWGDLMHALNTIEELGYDTRICKLTSTLNGRSKTEHVSEIETKTGTTIAFFNGSSKIEALWQCVIEFVKWYNTQQK
jgi:hypothetical protein